jgi:putative endopeptidase
VAPLTPWLQSVSATQTVAALFALLPRLNRLGIAPFFAAGVGVSPSNSSAHVLTIAQSGLGLPDPSSYGAASNGSAEIHAAYRAHIARMFALAGLNRSDADVAFNVEQSLASLFVPSVS